MHLNSATESKDSFSLASNNIADKIMEDYSAILKTSRLPHIPSGYYWQVGTIERTQGWILHLSVILTQVAELFKTVIPYLIIEKVAFKIPRDANTARYLLEGSLGFIHLAKVMCIYPPDDEKALVLGKTLLELTQPFTGPAIPTDRC